MANALRAAILTRKLAHGEKLPSGNELAQRYGVFVRERTTRAVAPRPHVERAFEQPKVSIRLRGVLR